MPLLKTLYGLLILIIIVLSACSTQSQYDQRQVQHLNGTWQVAQSPDSVMPTEFSHTVPVPGLVDMAKPAFDSVGYKSSLRQYFWYQKDFALSPEENELVLLRFKKAKYGLRAWLNGQYVGKHNLNFTETIFDITDHLRPDSTNTLTVRLFAFPDQLPDSIVWGHDFEKIKYIPGIYDAVSLEVTQAPLIRNVQVVPRIDSNQVKLVTWVDRVGATGSVPLQYRVMQGEAMVSEGQTMVPAEMDSLSFVVKIPDAQRWSPAEPNLYRLELSTAADSYSTEFGMRTFRFNPENNLAELNGEPLYLRGTNVCIHRFFEDETRENLPWDTAWVSGLMVKMQAMHWNSVRFCLGFPPEFWYEIADRKGILIQDEYPIWYGAKAEDFPATFTATQLAREYRAWMQERWNHPSVVIWDAQNESVTPLTGGAIAMVRDLDLSDRPWDNGYSPPQRRTDPIEAHPYVLQNYLGKKPGRQGPLYPYLHDTVRVPDNGPSELSPPTDGGRYPNPIISNEYGFFWITREGKPTYLTHSIYDNIYEDSLSTDEYRLEYAKTFARLTEYWRTARNSAAVMHFCVLGYSRSQEEKGFTSDNFTDVAQLAIEPHFEKYVYSAFYPVGIMIDRWEKWLPPGEKIDLTIKMINDYPELWSGQVSVQLYDDDRQEPLQDFDVAMQPLGDTLLNLPFTTPTELGHYKLVASFTDQARPPGGQRQKIFSEYDFEVRKATPEDATEQEENRQFIHSENQSE